MKIKKLLIIMMMMCVWTAANAQQDTLIRLPQKGVVSYSEPKRYLLKDVKVTGISTINTNMLINSLGLKIGDSIYVPSDYVSNAIKKLWQARLYSDIKVFQQTDGDDLYLELRLKDRPFVSDWRILGVSSAQRRELIESLRLVRNIQYSEYLVESSKKAIVDFYKKKGFYNVSVVPRIMPDTLKFQNRSFVKVDFVVDKKSKIKIKEITFDGITDPEIKAKRLRSAMKNNKHKSLFNIFKGAKYKEDKLQEDKNSIVAFLQSKGYRNATVLADSVYKVDDKKIGLNFKIYQGDKFYYRNISFTGNEKYPDDYLERILDIKKGDVYDGKNLKVKLGLDFAEVMKKGIVNIRGLYQNDGYLQSDVVPVETEVAKDTVDIDVRVFEGNQFTINDVIIAGNTRTHDKVVRRDLLIRPGELYSEQLLVNTIQRINQMGNFDQASVMPELLPVSNSLVDIKFNLEEASTDSFNFSGGFGGGTFVVGIGITFKNLSLKKMFKKGAWRPYPAGDNQIFKLQVQSNGTYYKNFSFTFIEPWLGGNKPNSLAISAYYSSQTNGRTVFDAGTASFATLGASARFGTRLSWPDPYFTFSAGLNYQHYKLKNWPNFLFKDGISHIIALELALSRNSVNSPLYPTSGSEFTIKLSATPPYSLMKKEGYYDNPNLTDQERYRFIEYYKVNFKARVFQGLLANEKLVFHAAAHFGYLGYYNKNAQSPFEGYSVGGSGIGGYNLYGIEYVSLRGYKDGSLTPLAEYGQQGRIYSKYTVELRYPFVNTPGTTMFGLIFAEGGNAYKDWKSFNPFELKKSIGVGLRIFLPIVGQFGLDLGYGFDRLPGETKPSGFQFHFTMGQEF